MVTAFPESPFMSPPQFSLNSLKREATPKRSTPTSEPGAPRNPRKTLREHKPHTPVRDHTANLIEQLEAMTISPARKKSRVPSGFGGEDKENVENNGIQIQEVNGAVYKPISHRRKVKKGLKFR